MGLFDKIFTSDKNEKKPQIQVDNKPVRIIPEKEFGIQLMQLIDVALSDKVLTSTEKTMLKELAIAKGVDIVKFENYINEQKTLRGVEEINDGSIPLKKYRQTTEVASELQTMIDMALADGYLSDEERKIILNEAKKFGVNIPTFEAGLNAMFMTGAIKHAIDSKFPTTVTKRFIGSEDIDGGKVVDTYEEITTAFRPNTNRGKEKELIKTTTKKIIKITRQKEMIEEVVNFLCDVDYSTVLSALAVVTVFSPVMGGAAVALVTTLKDGVEKFNRSGKKREPKAFLEVVVSEVSIDKCVTLLPNVQKYLGANGEKIVSGLISMHKVYAANKN